MKLAIQICAELEWRCTKSILKIKRLRHQPFGEYFELTMGGHEIVVYESGATKTRSAAACQFAIDTWQPDLILNLGTCGGVAENIREATVVLARKTFQYDVIQKFGRPSSRFKRGLGIDLSLSWFDLGKDSKRVCIGIIASADQDLDDEQRNSLKRRGVAAADWESASIATICRLNKIKCLILRGVSDIPERRKETGGGMQEDAYTRNAPAIMKDLFEIIGRITFR